MNAPQAVQAPDEMLLRTDSDGIATLTLNRPAQFNALSETLLDALQATLEAIGDDPSVRVVVIAASGRGFCAGHDLKEIRAKLNREDVEALFRKCSRMMVTLTRIPQPVVAKVHATATAAGCQLVAQCDLAVAANTARFATSGINFGLFCATPSVALARNLGRKQAMEMLLTGEFIDAEKAREWGLVNRVVAPDALDEAVDLLARTIAAKPAGAVASGKRMFYRQLETGLEDAYLLASDVMACNAVSGEGREGMDAFMEKRTPKWPERTGDGS